MRKKYLIIILAVIHFTCIAQPAQKIDSLQDILKNQKDDTSKVNTLNELSRQFLIIRKVTDAKKYAEDALVLAEKKGFKKGIASACHFLGIVYMNQNDYPEALKNYSAALKTFEEIGNKRGVADSYNNIGLIYNNQGNYPEALKNYMVSLKIKEDITDKNERDKREIAISYNNIGNIYSQQGNYPEGLKNYFASLKIKEEAGDKRGIGATYINIGIIYEKQGNYTDALKSYLASLKILEEVGDKYGVAISYANIGIIYTHQGRYSEALTNHLASLKICEEIGDKSGIADSYGNMGAINTGQGNYSQALQNYLAALKICEEIGDKRGKATSYNNIGKIYIKLNENPKAKEYLMNGLSLSKEIGSKDNIKDAYDGLAALDSAMGNYQQALLNYKLYTDYKDSLLNESNSKQIAGMKEQYESEKKDKEIVKLESEKQISALLIKTKQDSLSIEKAEKEKVKLENEKIQALNLYNQQQIELLGDEKLFQQLQIEKDQADYAVQKAEADKKLEQLVILNKEKTIQDLNLKKQKQVKNYFIAGLILFTILSYFIYRNYRTRQKLSLQTLRTKIAVDLHDDVGSTLSSISIISQMAQQQSKEVIPHLEKIEESSKKMLDAMADIVWTINPENDQLEKIILRMKSFAFELLGAKKIDFEFIVDDEVTKMNLSMDVRKNLYLIFKEAANNLAKYSGAGKALFKIEQEKNRLVMLIQDNGKGFDITQLTQGNGLNNMKKRSAEINAELTIKSSLDNGTTIQLNVVV